MSRTRLYSTTEAAEILGVPAARIREWKARGMVVPDGSIPGPGTKGEVPLYRLEALQDMADQYLTRKRHADTETGT